ncbi:MAG TPA: SPW repeat protein [Longimicrobium sp.]|nr:SPW repeat protein [Longimicrobium sp.]
MRLPTRVHGMLDYLLGALLIGSPWLFGFAAGGAEQWVPVALGAGVLLYSVFTDYELGLVKKLQMPAHLLLDALGGLALAVSPWLFGFDERVWMPHVVIGLVEVVTAAITNTVPGYERRRAGR